MAEVWKNRPSLLFIWQEKKLVLILAVYYNRLVIVDTFFCFE